MPTATIFFVNPARIAEPSSPLAGDPWEVTSFADAASAAAALEKRPDAVFLDGALTAIAGRAELLAACERLKTPVFDLDRQGGNDEVARALEAARVDRQIDQLRELGGDVFVAEMIDLFLGQTPGQLSALREALARGDVTAVKKGAHTLKSSAGNFGGHVLQELCARAERAAAADPASLPPILDETERAFARLKAHLESKR